jgi:isopenicillin-N epimerase
MITKADFLLDPNVVFMNHGSFGATPRVLLEEQRRWQELMERQPVAFFVSAAGLMRTVRERMGAYLHVSPNDVVAVTNSTYGVNVIVHAMANVLTAGDEILTVDHEYGACMRAWDRHCGATGVVIKRQHIPIPAPSMAEMTEIIWSGVTDRTKMIFLSHITSPTAIRLPVEEICRRAAERGILTFIDGAHGPAQLDLDLTHLGASAYTGNFHKWACTPKGSAFLWVAPSFQAMVPPLTVSWGSDIPTAGDGAFVDEHEYLGTRDLSPFLTLPAGMDWLEEIDWTSERERLRLMKNQTMERLLRIDGLGAVASDWAQDELLMGAVTLPPGTDVAALKHQLLAEHHIEVVVHEWLQKPMIRFSVHLHTTEADLEVLISAVSSRSVPVVEP